MKDLLRVGRFGPPFSSPQEPHCRMQSKVHPTYKTIWSDRLAPVSRGRRNTSSLVGE